MKSTLTLLVLSGVMPLSANAMEASASGSSQAAQSAVTAIDTRFNSGMSAMQAEINAIQACQALGEFYTAGHAGADANGCWSNISGATATGTIVAFNGTTCPSGWAEYTPARGKFLRGIDSSGSTAYDPAGKRAPGSYEADMLAAHAHTVGYWPAAWPTAVAGTSAIAGSGSGFTTTGTSTVGGAETRPRNVAVLFCQKS